MDVHVDFSWGEGEVLFYCKNLRRLQEVCMDNIISKTIYNLQKVLQFKDPLIFIE